MRASILDLPSKPYSNDVWLNIEVDSASLPHDRDGFPQYFTCRWCNQLASLTVTRTSQLTGETYTDYACSDHALQWLPK